MKKFQFKLQKLLDLRAFREKEAEMALAKAVSVRDGIRLRLQEIAEKELITRQNFYNRQNSNITDFTILEHYLRRLYTERDMQLSALAEAELTIEHEQSRYVQAHKDKLIITKLRDKKEVQWQEDFLKEQDNTIDDIVNTAPYKKNTMQ